MTPKNKIKHVVESVAIALALGIIVGGLILGTVWLLP